MGVIDVIHRCHVTQWDVPGAQVVAAAWAEHGHFLEVQSGSPPSSHVAVLIIVEVPLIIVLFIVLRAGRGGEPVLRNKTTESFIEVGLSRYCGKYMQCGSGSSVLSILDTGVRRQDGH